MKGLFSTKILSDLVMASKWSLSALQSLQHRLKQAVRLKLSISDKDKNEFLKDLM